MVTTLDQVLRATKAASRALARMSSQAKSAVLQEMAEAIERRRDEILSENEEDVAQAKKEHAEPALVDRLYLDEDRIADMAADVRAVAALPDPVGEIDHGWRAENGLQIVRERVPLGVVAVVHEGRPSVTSDAVALCLKSGNAIVLRGSRRARRSNRILAEVLTGALIEANAPAEAIALLGQDRDELRRLVGMTRLVDLVIGRGGPALMRFLDEHARVPVIHAASGDNHVYVHSDADLEMALRIVVNARAQVPAIGNSAANLLVHRDVAAEFLPRVVAALRTHGVVLQGRGEAQALLAVDGDGAEPAEPSNDHAAVMQARVVGSLEEAVAHVEEHGSGHSEAIVTSSLAAAQEFQHSVDAACVYVNASTRFTDGGVFGMGAEIANSTQKLHARGPIGLTELTTIKYLITGNGQVR